MGFRATAIVCISLWLSACATTPTEPLPEGLTEQPPASWSQRQSTLNAFQHWQLQGKLAVRQPSDSGTANINRWVQNNERYQLSLSSAFLGLGRTELDGVPGFLELTLPDGETYRSNDPEALVEAATGWQLPIGSLMWWIKGLPDPASDFRLLFNKAGELAVIRQQGWEIRFERWQSFIDEQPSLPARITALKEDKRVRVVVTDWQNTPEQP